MISDSERKMNYKLAQTIVCDDGKWEREREKSNKYLLGEIDKFCVGCARVYECVREGECA